MIILDTEPSPSKNKSMQYYSGTKVYHHETGVIKKTLFLFKVITQKKKKKKENFELRVKYFDEGLLKNIEGEEVKFLSLKDKLIKLK